MQREGTSVNSWPERNRSVVLAFLAAVIVVGLVILVLQHRGGPKPLEIRFDDPALDGRSIEVYVTGAVQEPGVYTLHEGDRIEDALAAAGGPTQDADTESLNLALRVRDQDQISVQRGDDGIGTAVASTPIANQKLDINSATAQELDALPGIGEVYSQRIVDSRVAEGPFHRPEELVERKVIPSATYDHIKDLITVSP
jgi:competence protein ComEA